MLLKRLFCHLLLAAFVLPTAWASNLDPQQITGKYHTANPERGSSSNVMQLAEYQGNTVIAVAACEQGCPPSVYVYLEEESAQVGNEVFRNGYGLYLLH